MCSAFVKSGFLVEMGVFRKILRIVGMKIVARLALVSAGERETQSMKKETLKPQQTEICAKKKACNSGKRLLFLGIGNIC